MRIDSFFIVSTIIILFEKSTLRLSMNIFDRIRLIANGLLKSMLDTNKVFSAKTLNNRHLQLSIFCPLSRGNSYRGDTSPSPENRPLPANVCYS